MFLKAIEVHGFKSFPAKTSINLEKGITVIVGPNGSGKSNVSDAVRWVLGELSPKILRGAKMDDVIFSGTSDVRPANFARVSLILDNADGSNPNAKETGEIKVTRMLTRMGESGYFINDKAARLKDIYELFADTGLGKDGYSIISQGRIAEIITKRGEELRNIFEEAAGIAKYRAKKDETERRLKGIRDDLTRIKDITIELESRLEPLKRESGRAREYLKLKEEKDILDINFMLGRIDAIKPELDKIETNYENIMTEYEAATEEIAKSEYISEELYEKIQRVNYKIEGKRNRKIKISEEIASKRSDIAISNGKLQDLEAETKKINDENSNITVRMADAERLIRERQDIIENIIEEYIKIEEDIKATEESINALYATEEATALGLGGLRSDAEELKKELFAIEKKIIEYENDEKYDEKNSAERLRELEQFNSDIESETSLINRGEEKLNDILNQKREKSDALSAAEAGITKLNTRKTDCEGSISGLNLRFEANERHIKTLEAISETLEGFSEGVRNVIREAKAKKLNGIRGTISQLVSAPEEYSIAVETALGANIQNIVVDDENASKAAIRFLKETNGGRATFYPLSTIKPGNPVSVPDEIASLEGYMGFASELAKYDDEYENIITYVLGRTIICDNLDNANIIAKRTAYKIKVVTMDGQAIHIGGSFTGGSLRKRGPILSQKDEIAHLKEENDDISDDKVILSQELKEIKEEIEAGVKNSSVIKLGINALNAAESEIRTYLSVHKAAAERLDSARDAKLKEIETEKSTLPEKKNEYLKTREELNACLDELDAKTKEIEALSSILDATVREKNSLSRLNNELKLKAREVNGELNIERERLLNLEKQKTAIADGGENNKLRASGIVKEMAEYAEKIKNSEADLKVLSAEADLGDEEISSSEEERTAFEKQIADLKILTKEKSQRKEILYREKMNAEIKKAAAEKNHDVFINRLWDEYELSYSSAVQYAEENKSRFEEYNPGQDISKRLNVLKDKMKNYVNVNLGAIEEYAAVNERHGFLCEQSGDAEKAAEALIKIIDELNVQMKEILFDAVKNLNNEFNNVFVELFGGGSAEIIVSEPDNIMNSDFEINVRPPGKNIKQLSLLSGGEQAFVAIALYFALLKMNPSPFCILDEIEAALDEANIEKFSTYVKKYADKTQFIIITHRRGTMEIADRLYGITMQKRGISRYFSVDINEIEQKTGVKVQ